MDDERIESDALAAVDFLTHTTHDLAIAVAQADTDPQALLLVRSTRFQAMHFLGNYFNRQNAPFIAAAEAQAIANAPKPPES